MSSRASLIYAVVALFVPAVVACATSGDGGQTGDDQNVVAHAPKPGERGGACAGFAGTQCKAGLHCLIPPGPHVADALGTCADSDGPTCKFPVTCHDGTSGCADKSDPCASHGGECSAKGDACVTEHDCCSNLKCDNDSAKPKFECVAR